MTDDTIELDPILVRFRKTFRQLDGVADDAGILVAVELAREMEIADEDSLTFLFAVAHLVVSERLDVSGETMSLKVGDVERKYVPMSMRGSDSTFWTTSDFGRKYLTLVRSKKAVNAFDLQRDFEVSDG